MCNRLPCALNFPASLLVLTCTHSAITCTWHQSLAIKSTIRAHTSYSVIRLLTTHLNTYRQRSSFCSPTILFSTSKRFTNLFTFTIHDLQWHLQHSKDSGSWSVLFYILEITITTHLLFHFLQHCSKPVLSSHHVVSKPGISWHR